MSELLDACSELRKRWMDHQLPLAEHLRPAMPADQLKAVMGGLGISPPRDLLDWWSWHDGVAEGVDANFGTGLLFSVQQALDDYRMQGAVAVQAATEDRPASFWWNPMWFPISRSGYGGEVTVDCAGSVDDRSEILMVHMGDDDFWIPRATGLAQLVQWWVRAWDVGVYTYDSSSGSWGYNWQLLGEHGLPTIGGIV